MEQMYEISFEHIEDGSIRLEQQSGYGERDVIHLHPDQLKFITRRMCGMSETTAAQVADLERKLSILSGDLESIVTEKSLRLQIVDCEDGVELITRLDALLDLSVEFDGGRLIPRSQQEPQESATSNSSGKPAVKPPVITKSAAKPIGAEQLGLNV